MSSSLIGADYRSHCKIVAVACAGSLVLALAAGAGWRTEPVPRSAAERSFAAATSRDLAATARRGDGLAKMRQDVVSRARAAFGSADAS